MKYKLIASEACKKQVISKSSNQQVLHDKDKRLCQTQRQNANNLQLEGKVNAKIYAKNIL